VSKERIDAEYYHPEKKQTQIRLSTFSGNAIEEYFVPIREIYTPDTSDDAIVLNFDLTDALNPILTEAVQTVVAGELGSSKKQFRKGDIVISRLRSYLKEIAIVDTETNRKVFGSSEFIVLRPKSSVNSELLLAYLHTNAVQTILKWSQDGSNHPRFQEEEFLSIKLPDTVIGQQEKVKDLTRQAIKSHRQSIQLYAEAERLLSAELGLDRLDLSESLFNVRRVSDVFNSKRLDAEFYQEKYYRLEDAITHHKYSSKTLSKLIEPIKNGFDFREFTEEGTPYIRVGDVRKGRIDFDNAAKIPVKSDEVQKDVGIKIGDVLFTRKGTFGNAAVVRRGQEQAIISSEIMLLRLQKHLDMPILPDYLALFLNSKLGYQQVTRKVHGVAYYSISQPDLAQVLVVVPPMDIQERVADKIQASLEAEKNAKRLLAEAKSEVERLIEKA